MAITDEYTLYAININKTADVLLKQIVSQSMSAGLRKIIEASDGEVDPRYVAVMDQRPTMGFSTTDIKTALDLAGISGHEIDVDDGAQGALEMFFQKLAEGGTRAGAGNHMKLAVNEGILIPVTLSASQGGRATLTYLCVCTYDGTNNPIVIAISQDLAAGTPGTAVLWTLGPIELNGTLVNGIVDVSINFGIDLRIDASDGEHWARFVAIMNRQPSVSFSTPDVGLFNTLGLSGAAQGATDSLVYLRKLAEGSTRVADATAEHIKITVDEGHINVEDITTEHGQRAGVTGIITPTYDGTNAILAIDTAAAIA